MTRLWFIVPAHGRLGLSRICLGLLAQTCEQLHQYEIEATAVVIADDENLELAESLGFATVRRDNDQVGRKLNDGYQLACDPDFNPRPADWAVPIGTDDWVLPEIFETLPRPDRIGMFRLMGCVDETRTKLARLKVPYLGGCGIRLMPSSLLALTGYRPCEEDRGQALDTSTLREIRKANRRRMPDFVELDRNPYQIVDWKSNDHQLHPFLELRPYKHGDCGDPFSELKDVYPAWALEAVRDLA